MVVDSGADESCVPAFLSSAGESLGHKGPDFCDAQGNALQVHDRRTCVKFRNVHEKYLSGVKRQLSLVCSWQALSHGMGHILA